MVFMRELVGIRYSWRDPWAATHLSTDFTYDTAIVGGVEPLVEFCAFFRIRRFFVDYFSYFRLRIAAAARPKYIEDVDAAGVRIEGSETKNQSIIERNGNFFASRPIQLTQCQLPSFTLPIQCHIENHVYLFLGPAHTIMRQ